MRRTLPFCTIRPGVGVVSVPDKQLSGCATSTAPNSPPPVIEFVDDIGVWSRNAWGEVWAAIPLPTSAACDAIVHVVRCFDDADILRTLRGSISTRCANIGIHQHQLIMADLEMIDRRIDKAQKNAKGGDKRFNHEVEVFTALRDYMNEGNLARTFRCSETTPP